LLDQLYMYFLDENNALSPLETPVSRRYYLAHDE
jgi:hypothetical protein